MLKAKLKWRKGIVFEGENLFGNKIIVDGLKSEGGEEAGIKPTELLLYGIAGCTGIDVVSILKKMRQEFSSLEIEITAHQEKEPPRPFHTIEIKYIVRGDGIDPGKLAEAIRLSQEKYCAVSLTVANETQVNTSFEIVP